MKTRLPLRLLALLAGPLTLIGAVTIDRIAVIVGKHAIKTSDIDRDIRLTDFMNAQALDFGVVAKRQSAERLIDQEIIRQEIATGGYRRPPDADADALQAQLVHDRFGGSSSQFRQALTRFSLTQDQVHAQLLWQLTVLRFIDQRFRTGVFVSDDDVKQYALQHLADLKKANPGASQDTLESMSRESLEGERVNQNFAGWLERARMRTRIEYKQEAFS